MTKRIPISLLMVVLIAAGIFVATNASPARACAEPVSRILYSQSSECTSTLWVMNPDGTGASQVSLPYSLIRGISWAPGHNKIAFSLFKDSDFEIYVMDADGSNVTRITDRVGTDTAPSWSPAAPVSSVHTCATVCWRKVATSSASTICRRATWRTSRTR